MTHRTLLIALMALSVPLGSAAAASLDATKRQAWSSMDRCHKESLLKFPDLTKDGEEQRKNYVRTCQIARSQATGQAPILRN
jgi:hypothetical protein